MSMLIFEFSVSFQLLPELFKLFGDVLDMSKLTYFSILSFVVHFLPIRFTIRIRECYQLDSDTACECDNNGRRASPTLTFYKYINYTMLVNMKTHI